MPVYTIPYDQSSRRYLSQTPFSKAPYRFIATEFPALFVSNVAQSTVFYPLGLVSSNINAGERWADVVLRSCEPPVEYTILDRQRMIFRLPSLTSNDKAVNSDHAEEANSEPSLKRCGELNPDLDEVSTEQDEDSIQDQNMQVYVEDGDRTHADDTEEEAEQEVDTDDNKRSEKPSTLHRFMEIPRETRETFWDMAVRDEPYMIAGIYKRYFTHPIELRKNNSSDFSIFSFQPAMCRLSRETRSETVHVFLRTFTFFVCSYRENQYLTAFLDKYDGYRSVRGLHFEYFDFYNSRPEHQSATNADLELYVRCTGLKEVKIRMHNTRLGQQVWMPLKEDHEYLPVPVQSIWDFFKLNRLTACDSLTKVAILRKGLATDAANQAAVVLVSRVENEFLVLGRHVTVEAVYA